MKSASPKILILCACLLIANGFLQWLVDNDMGVCWTHNVLRNWGQFGLLPLKAQLVQNPGGHGALEHPDIYPGHRPTSLFPAYVIGRMFHWTGSYALPYHLISTFAALVSIYYLLGSCGRALFFGGLAVLTPGYLVEPTILDPNAVAILGGLPYAALLWWQLTLPKLTARNYIFLALLTFAYTALNWTTALIHAQIFFTLFLCRKTTLQRLAYYVMIGAGSAMLVVIIGVMAKLSEKGRGKSAFGDLIGSYMWGDGGYSDGSDTRTLLVRLAFINVLALLPLWLALAWKWIRLVKTNAPLVAVSSVPLVLAILETLVMRNYFSHHPWMAAPLLLVGWVFTMTILELPRTSPDRASSPATNKLWIPAWPAGLVLAFGFGFAILMVNRIHSSQLYSLIALVRQGTQRSDDIIIVENRDPQLAAVANRLAENLDREVGMVDELPAPKNSATGAVLLSAVPLGDGWHESGRTKPANSLPMINSALQWFTDHISKRKAGDKMELADIYYMYFVNPPSKFKTPATGVTP